MTERQGQMTGIPTRFATIRADWGSGKKHIYSMSEWELSYFNTEQEARADAEERVREGEKMIAILEVKALILPKPTEFEVIT